MLLRGTPGSGDATTHYAYAEGRGVHTLRTTVVAKTSGP